MKWSGLEGSSFALLLGELPMSGALKRCERYSMSSMRTRGGGETVGGSGGGSTFFVWGPMELAVWVVMD